MGLVEITKKNEKNYLPEIRELENSAEYPLGDDSFKIEHGENYFSFFNRLGILRYFVWHEKKQVAAVAAGIIRRVPKFSKGPLMRAWYLCDLKVKKEFRRQHIPLKMLSRAFLINYLRCPRGYSIAMNSTGEHENKIARLLARFPIIPIRIATRLLIWSCDSNTMENLKPLIEKHRGEVSFISLIGIKDIVLSSTNLPMPLYHVQFGPLADPTATKSNEAEGVYMFCSPESDELSVEIISRGINPTSSATVIANNMSRNDWTWILTSDI